MGYKTNQQLEQTIKDLKDIIELLLVHNVSQNTQDTIIYLLHSGLYEEIIDYLNKKGA